MCYKQKCKVVSLNLAHPVVIWAQRHCCLLIVLLVLHSETQKSTFFPFNCAAYYWFLRWQLEWLLEKKTLLVPNKHCLHDGYLTSYELCNMPDEVRNYKLLMLCWRTGGDHQDPSYYVDEDSIRTWNPTTSSWMKQLMWLRIVQSTLETDVYVLYYALLVVHTRNDDNDTVEVVVCSTAFSLSYTHRHVQTWPSPAHMQTLFQWLFSIQFCILSSASLFAYYVTLGSFGHSLKTFLSQSSSA